MKNKTIYLKQYKGITLLFTYYDLIIKSKYHFNK